MSYTAENVKKFVRSYFELLISCMVLKTLQKNIKQSFKYISVNIHNSLISITFHVSFKSIGEIIGNQILYCSSGTYNKQIKSAKV